ncbi:MAG: hypothetical protein QXU88_02260 [Candidatus Woesearchaeota archaeon]
MSHWSTSLDVAEELEKEKAEKAQTSFELNREFDELEKEINNTERVKSETGFNEQTKRVSQAKYVSRAANAIIAKRQPKVSKPVSNSKNARNPNKKHKGFNNAKNNSAGTSPVRSGGKKAIAVVFALIILVAVFVVAYYGVRRLKATNALPCALPKGARAFNLENEKDAEIFFWLEKALTTEDDKLSTEIFKMLACEQKISRNLEPSSYADCATTAYLFVTEDTIKLLDGVSEKAVVKRLFTGKPINKFSLIFSTQTPKSMVFKIE